MASKSINNFDFTIGIGWGLYDAGVVLDNPLAAISERFDSRNYNYDTIGEFDIDDYFSGADSSVFGSAQYTHNEHKFILELNPVDTFYERFGSIGIDSRFYLGYEYSNDLLSSKIFYGDSGDLNFQFTASYDYKKVNKKFVGPNKRNKSKILNLLSAIQVNGIGLKEAYISEQNELVLGKGINSYSNISEATKNIKSLDYADVNNDQEIVIKHFSFGKEIISEELLSKKLYEKHKSKTYEAFIKNKKIFLLLKLQLLRL